MHLQVVSPFGAIVKTIQIKIEEDLLSQIDQVVQSLHVTRSAFICQALRLALRERKIVGLEQKHIAGYRRFPVTPGEFDL